MATLKGINPNYNRFMRDLDKMKKKKEEEKKRGTQSDILLNKNPRQTGEKISENIRASAAAGAFGMSLAGNAMQRAQEAKAAQAKQDERVGRIMMNYAGNQANPEPWNARRRKMESDLQQMQGQNAQQKEAERAGRTLMNYAGNKLNPEPWNKGTQQMQSDLQQMQEQKQQQDRVGRILLNYTGNRINPEPWNTRRRKMDADLQQMQQEKSRQRDQERVDRILMGYNAQKMNPRTAKMDRLMGDVQKMQEPQEQTKAPDISDYMKYQNVMDPKSGFNQNLERFIGKLPADRQQQEREYWANFQEGERQKQAEAEKLLKELQETWRLQQGYTSSAVTDRAGYISDWDKIRDSELYTGKVLQKMSDAQLKQLRANYEQEIGKYENRTPKGQDEAENELIRKGRDRVFHETVSDYGVPVEENSMTGELGIPDVSRWGSLQGAQYIRERPEEYFMYDDVKDDWDRMLYDAIYGYGAWETAVNTYETPMFGLLIDTDAKKMKMQQEMEDLWERIENGEIAAATEEKEKEFFEAEENTDAPWELARARKNLDNVNKELENRRTAEKFEENVPDADTEYHEETDKHESDLDTIYKYLTGSMWESIDNKDVDLLTRRVISGASPAFYMNDAQRETFLKYMNAGDRESAQAYYDALKPWLQDLQYDAQTEYYNKLAQNGSGYAGSSILARLAMKPLGGVMGIAGTGLALAGNEDAQSKYSPWYKIEHMTSSIQQGRVQEWANLLGQDVGTFVGNTIYSVADNVIAMLATMGLSGDATLATDLAQNMLLFIMSSEATSATMLQRLEAGYDPEEAALFSLGSGVIEYITEKVSLDVILSQWASGVRGKDLLKRLGLSMLAEGTEEINADLMGTTLDYILSEYYGHKPELEQQLADMMEADPSLTKEQAWKKVVENYLGQVGLSGLAGALSGLALSGTMGAATNYRNNQYNTKAGQQVMDFGTDATLSENQQSEVRERNIRQLIEGAQKMGPETESRKAADEIAKLMEKGKTVKPAEIGALYRSLMAESGTEIQGIVNDIMGDAIMAEMEEMGETGRYGRKVTQALLRMMNGEASAQDLMMLAESDAAQNILSEYGMKGSAVAEAAAKTDRQTNKLRSIQEKIGPMGILTQTSEEAVRNVEESMKGAETAVAADTLLRGRTTGAANEVMTEDGPAEIEGFRLVKDQKTGNSWNVKLKNGQTVNLFDVKALKPQAARVMKYLESDAGRTVGENLAGAMITLDVEDAAPAVAGAMQIMYAMRLGLGDVRTVLNAKQTQAVREAVQADLDAEDAERIKNPRPMTPGQGKATYNGLAYGTDAFNAAVNRLGKKINKEAQAVGAIAKALGIQVEMVYDPEKVKEHGYFTTENGIHINLAGEFVNGVRKNAIATLSHEIPHWFAVNSPNEYKNLRNFMVRSLRQSGFDVVGELENIVERYRNYNKTMTIGDAVEEIVSMGCESVLTNESLINRMQQEDATLFGSMKSAVRNLISRIRGLRNDARVTSSRYGRAMQAYADELEKLWIRTYNEAKQAARFIEKEGIRNITEKAADAMLEAAGEVAYDPAHYSFAGEGATGIYGDDVRTAMQMERDGATDEQIREATNCIRGFRGRWWRVIDNNATLKINPEEVKAGVKYTMKDIMDFAELYKAYPAMQDIPVYFKKLAGNIVAQVTDSTLPTVTINTDFLYKGEGILQEILHEGQHYIQTIEGSHKGSNPLYWSDMQNMAYARLANNDRVMDYILNKVGIEGQDALMFGIEFNEDGTVNTEYLSKEEEQKISKMRPADLEVYRQAEEDSMKWIRLLREGMTSTSLYTNTVGEIEARAAAAWTSEDTGINYDKNTVAREDYSREEVTEPGWSETVRRSVQELDEKYEEAVKNQDWKTAEEMLIEKAEKTAGITGYNAVHYYNGAHKDIARAIKSGSQDVISRVVEDMAQKVPDNAVLVPIPPHEGTVTEDTDTYILANALSEKTGAPVVVALQSDPHESRYQAKKSGNRNVTAENMGFRQIAEIPEGKIPVFIDNMVGGGQTAIAARNAVGRGITLAYAQNSRSKTQGVKYLSVTYDDNGKLIPISQRMDPNNKSWKYSLQENIEEKTIAELEQDYEDAYNSYDDEWGEKIVAAMAEKAMPNSKVRDKNGKLKVVYHQTNADPFTVFNMDRARQTEDIVGAYFAPEFDVYHEYGDRTYAVYLNIENPAYDIYDMDISVEGAGLIKRNELIAQGYDGVINTEDGKVVEYIAFYPEQIKSAEPFTEDDDGDFIPLIERFNKWNDDIRYSVQDNEIRNEQGEALAEVLPGDTITKYSYQSWTDEDIPGLIQQLIQRGFDEKSVTKWIRDVNGIAKMIADNKDVLDYEASPFFTMLKNNQEYIKTLDASTLCAKRLLYQGIFNEIQRQLENTPLMPEDLIKLINMMKKKGLVTPCGFCYVESRRKMLGKYANEWLKGYKGAYQPTMWDVTTTEGLERLQNAPEGSPMHDAYDSFVEAMKAKGSANPKVVQTRTDYRGEIRKLTDNQIEKVKEIGGLRVQSFSDFEVIHMIDMMQAVLDMAAMELTSQAYTKVPEFAWVFGDTGMKINLSLVGKGTGVDANGQLVFDDVEGMPWEKAMELRKRYSKNVGTILVGINEEHIIAAMGDNRIDFIIPFHKSGWNKKEMTQINGMNAYKDFTRWQNEKKIASWTKDGVKTIPNKRSKISNFGPVNSKQTWDGQSGYWDFSKTGTQNAEEYLRLCKEDGRVPKFANFLAYDGEGGYQLPTGNDQRSKNIRNGYWKLLIDFKMYDNAGKGSPQTTVQPVFNMTEARKILANYDGNTKTLPKDQELADQFVEEYKKEHPRKSYSIQDESDVDMRAWMETVQEGSLRTEAEKQLLQDYKGLRMRVSLKAEQENSIKKKIAEIEKTPEENRTQEQKKQLAALQIRLQNVQNVKEQTQEQLAKVTGNEGFMGMMYRAQRTLNDFVYGKTQAEVRDSVEALEKSAERIAERIRENLQKTQELEKNGTVETFRKLLGTTTADQAAADLKKAYHSTWTKKQIRTFLDPIVTKMMSGENYDADVEQLAGILIDSDSENTAEELTALRGLTITVGKGALKELRGMNSSLKEIRAMLAGTGITVKSGETSTLDKDIEDLRAEYPNMPDFGNEKDALMNFVDWVVGLKNQRAGNEFYYQRLAEAMGTIVGKAAGIAKNVYMPTDSKAQQQVRNMMDFVRSLNAETQSAMQMLQDVLTELETLQKSGRIASGMANSLVRDANVAIDYFDRTAKMAMDQAKQKKQSAIIAQLKSDFAQKIAKNNEEWRALVKRDADARKQLDENNRTRGQITTVLKYMLKRMKAPKGTFNIPEHMQGVVREVLETFVNNDMNGMRHIILRGTTEGLAEARRLLEAWKAQDGPFNMADLQEMEDEDISVHNIMEDLQTIYDGIAAWNGDFNGKNKLDTLRKRGEILKQIQEAVSEIWSAVKAENSVIIRGNMVALETAAYNVITQTGGRMFREWTGPAGRRLAALHNFLISGNLTPEYFFRMIDNAGMSDLWANYHDAENRNGLELAKSKAKLAQIAEKHGYREWDLKQKVKLKLEKGGEVEVTLGQLMSLYATWKREQTLGPAMSQHLSIGGFYAEQDLRDGALLGRKAVEKKAHRMTEDDFAEISGILTDEQKAFVDDVVEYMSSDMSELGNEASMKAFGIKLYKEKYYFPFQMWGGIKSRKSNDAGAGANADRAFHPSFSKSRLHGANNALVIGDFMQTAADHIAGMINYATIGLANESMQKTMNYQMKEGENVLEYTKRNAWTRFEEAYGMEAAQYLRNLQKQLNGGAVKTEKTFADKVVTMFRKNAVAGSLSVAAQQPLSYIRAAMMINPKYLARAISPEYWKGSYKEMLAHSGVAVIKEMGRFDVNFGQSAREYLEPDSKEGKIRKGWNAVTDVATALPEKLDAMTWTRMWSAVKIEQHEAHPEMDMKSDEFLDLCGERFNEIMRLTQVYDSMLVKSPNMRSDSYLMKNLTSFMAEPTLTWNVLLDAARQATSGKAGGKALLAKAGATYMLSAVLQAAIKALFSSGRSPDDKKTWLENWLNRFGQNMISELDPFQLVPGYSEVVTLMKDGKVSDDAMGSVGKMITAGRKAVDLVIGRSGGSYGDIEDSIGQLTQLITNLPLKNLMRDGRAMYNWFIEPPYAQRDSSGAVMKYQFLDSFNTADNLWGVINKYLGDAGWGTSNENYLERIKDAYKDGREQDVADMRDYLVLGKGISGGEDAVRKGVNRHMKKDEDVTAEETYDFLKENEYGSLGTYVIEQYKAGALTREQAEEKYAENYPDKTPDEIYWKFDEIDYEAETGKDVSGKCYRLWDAMDANKNDEIRKAAEVITAHGVTPQGVKTQITKQYKQRYIDGTNAEKVKIRDAVQKAYKALGYTAEDADKTMKNWK